MKIIVTGGAGFIGSALVRHLVLDRGWHVTNVDKLTYAANLSSLSPVADKQDGVNTARSGIECAS